MIEFTKIQFLRKSTKFVFKIREKFCLFLFNNVHKENIFNMEIENGREAPFKPSLFINMLNCTEKKSNAV